MELTEQMESTKLFRSNPALLAMLRAFLAAVLTTATALTGTPTAQADPMTVCPPNQPSGWNGQQCLPQPCVPPYVPGTPPCFMPSPQIGPNGVWVIE